jgi:hypothetical protein
MEKQKTYEERKQEILAPIFITHEEAVAIREQNVKEMEEEDCLNERDIHEDIIEELYELKSQINPSEKTA